jgi:heme exporter protein D
VLSPFAHPVFTAMTGIGIALAVRARRPGFRVIAVVGGLLGAIALHSLWNTSTGLLGGLGFLLAYPLVFVPVFVALLITVAYARRRELQTVGRELRREVQTGLLPAGELAALSSPRIRRHALRRARKVGVKGLRKRFHVTATELAFLREQAHTGRYVGLTSPTEQDAAYQHELRRLQEELAARAAGASPAGARLG